MTLRQTFCCCHTRSDAARMTCGVCCWRRLRRSHVCLPLPLQQHPPGETGAKEASAFPDMTDNLLAAPEELPLWKMGDIVSRLEQLESGSPAVDVPSFTACGSSHDISGHQLPAPCALCTDRAITPNLCMSGISALINTVHALQVLFHALSAQV